MIGDYDVISNLTVDDIKVTASLDDLTAGTHSIPVKVTLPDNVKLIDSDQSKEIVIELTETENQATTTLPEEELEPSSENEPTSNDGDHGNADLSTSGGE
ncbi:hypothetical protein D3C77_715610 [compost metagenome]